MQYLSVCSGIEAATQAWHSLGWRPVAFSEIESFPSAVLAERWPEVPNLGDFTTIDAKSLGPVDVLVGGTPCQGFSVAGLRGGLADDRSNLMLAYVRLAHELNPEYTIWENVPGVLNMPDNTFGCFLGGLVGADAPLCLPAGRRRWPSAGMVAGPKARAVWRILDAQYFGLAQRRKRVFVIAGFRSWTDPAAVLFEPKSGGWYLAPRREARENITGTLNARTSAGGGLEGIAIEDGTGRGILAYGGNNTSGPIDVAAALNAKGGVGRMDFDSETFVTAFDCKAGAIGDIPGTLRGNGHGGGHTAVGVRRLTPRECERLMGFPDDYTAIIYRGKPAADGPRYRALGNSMAVSIMCWIGQRICGAIHHP
jgi:DNA (cytosine-5)-methyltransferase 1